MRALVVVIMAVVVVAALAGCSSGGSKGDTPPTASSGDKDASGWSKQDVAKARSVASQISTGLPGQCTKFDVTPRDTYINGVKKIGGPYPDAVGLCDTLTEELEISAFSTSSARDDFVTSRRDKLCHLADEKKVGLPGLYWVVGGDWSVQPDSEGVARRVAQAINGQFKATGCNGKYPGWDDASVATLEQTASKLVTNHLGCADIEMQDRDLVSHTPPYTVIGTPAAAANCTLSDGAIIVLAAYNTPADKTDKLIEGELGRECSASGSIRIVRAGDVAIFTNSPATAAKVASAVDGSISPLVCKK